mgnify:CR=1 FL=1
MGYRSDPRAKGRALGSMLTFFRSLVSSVRVVDPEFAKFLTTGLFPKHDGQKLQETFRTFKTIFGLF